MSLEVKRLFGGSSSKQAQPSGSSMSSESLLCRAEWLYKELKRPGKQKRSRSVLKPYN